VTAVKKSSTITNKLSAKPRRWQR